VDQVDEPPLGADAHEVVLGVVLVQVVGDVPEVLQRVLLVGHPQVGVEPPQHARNRHDEHVDRRVAALDRAADPREDFRGPPLSLRVHRDPRFLLEGAEQMLVEYLLERAAEAGDRQRRGRATRPTYRRRASAEPGSHRQPASASDLHEIASVYR
jgi:hypothetical protein